MFIAIEHQITYEIASAERLRFATNTIMRIAETVLIPFLKEPFYSGLLHLPRTYNFPHCVFSGIRKSLLYCRPHQYNKVA